MHPIIFVVVGRGLSLYRVCAFFFFLILFSFVLVFRWFSIVPHRRPHSIASRWFSIEKKRDVEMMRSIRARAPATNAYRFVHHALHTWKLNWKNCNPVWLLHAVTPPRRNCPHKREKMQRYKKYKKRSRSRTDGWLALGCMLPILQLCCLPVNELNVVRASLF